MCAALIKAELGAEKPGNNTRPERWRAIANTERHKQRRPKQE
jgi:hypothetical protein